MICLRFAFVSSLAALSLAGCSGPQAMTTPSTAIQPATRSLERSLHGYYLIKFATQVGGDTGIVPSLCFRFMSSGRWYSTSSNLDYSGTYLTAGKDLFASAAWPASPVLYMALQGSVNAKQGSGKFVISGESGDISGGGTFTMAREQNSKCS
jgi:hypothetical protein